MKVNIAVSKITAQQKEKNRQRIEQLGEIIKEDSHFYLPRDQDTLFSSAAVMVTGEGTATISWNTPYAKFLYYGKVMVGKESRSAFAKRGETKVVTNADLHYSKDKNPHAQKEWFEAAKKTKLSQWLRQASALFGGKKHGS